jgi:hypothetical protein
MSIAFHPVLPSIIVAGTFNGKFSNHVIYKNYGKRFVVCKFLYTRNCHDCNWEVLLDWGENGKS